ncbi:hypothetical protein [Tenacibaculum piscium]|uniref:hypothetical protein n=1 Tax=Tenacibaculum piscium TaxID=1458515 RepID=UPI001F312A74|nr:hypothetical protein [Tenacibaculum piscium]
METCLEALNGFTNVEIYCDIIKESLRLINYKIYPTEEEHRLALIKKMKLEKSYDIELFISCIDLIEDAQYAINEVNEYGLSLGKIPRRNEMYLRLYGVLNAAYIQILAIKDLLNLLNLLNFSEFTEIHNHLKKVRLIELRNKIASHSTNYDDGTNERCFFRLVQASLSKSGKNIQIEGRNESEDFNLLDCLASFTNEVEFFLDKIVVKQLEKTYKKEAIDDLTLKYNYIKK